jgi:uncharacterized delta-60 repeat protein
MPDELQKADLPQGELKAYLVVDGDDGNRYEMMLISGTYTVTVPGLAPGEHILKVVFEFESSLYGNTPVLLATQEQLYNLEKNERAVLDFSADQYITGHDSDGDNYTNLQEVTKGGHPTDPDIIPDIISPTLGNTFLKFTQPTDSGFTIEWQEAADNVTQPAMLEYRLVYSPDSLLDSVEEVINNSVAYNNWANSRSAQITGLPQMTNPQQAYQVRWNVVVRDEQKNISIYSPVFPNGMGLDTSFGGVGYVTHDNAAGGGQDDTGLSVAIDSSGRIVVAGVSENLQSSQASEINDMVIWRYTVDGYLDTEFNNVGFVTHNGAGGGSGNNRGQSIAIDDTGRIVVTGHSVNSSNYADMAIWRYTNEGELDTTFNSIGYVTFDSQSGAAGTDSGDAVVIDRQGRIVVAGWRERTVDASINVDMAIWRYTNEGELDTTFNGTGFVTHDAAAGGDDEMGHSVAIDSMDNIVVTGWGTDHTGNIDMAIWRYTDLGELDTSFNQSGFVTHHNAAGGDDHDYGLSVVIDKEDRIVVSGYSVRSRPADGIDTYMVIWRYTGDGKLDTTFNNIGFVTHNGAGGGTRDDQGASITIDDVDRILVTGISADVSGYVAMAMWRYTPGGELDTTFNNTGYFTHNGAAGGDNHDYGLSIATDSKGRMVVVGNSRNSKNDYDMTIWQYR